MEQIIEKEINPISNLIIFGGYCFGGMTMLSYFSYKAFKNVGERVRIDRPLGQKLTLSKMKALPGLSKTILVSSIYLAGWVYLAWKLNLNDRVFQSTIQKDKQYTDKIKLDPFFQNFYIINTMKYFNISERLIRKTEQQLRQKVEEGKEKGQIKLTKMASFEKSMIYLALKLGGQTKLQALK